MNLLAVMVAGCLTALLAGAPALAQKVDDCSRYSGVEKEACEKLARKKQG